jgi:hypothetical protein
MPLTPDPPLNLKLRRNIYGDILEHGFCTFLFKDGVLNLPGAMNLGVQEMYWTLHLRLNPRFKQREADRQSKLITRGKYLLFDNDLNNNRQRNADLN